jgi:hypothetical protein
MFATHANYVQPMCSQLTVFGGVSGRSAAAQFLAWSVASAANQAAMLDPHPNWRAYEFSAVFW